MGHASHFPEFYGPQTPEEYAAQQHQDDVAAYIFEQRQVLVCRCGCAIAAYVVTGRDLTLPVWRCTCMHGCPGISDEELRRHTGKAPQQPQDTPCAICKGLGTLGALRACLALQCQCTHRAGMHAVLHPHRYLASACVAFCHREG